MISLRPPNHPLPLRSVILTASLALATTAGALSFKKVPEPPREFRATWIATVYNIDWPSSPKLSASAQQAELRSLLDLAASLKLNAVILQVRPACDAFYQSSREPWSSFLTGREGRSPGYDPLTFAVNEAHARGLELHAWFNPFRASTSENVSHSSRHVTKSHPSAVRRYGRYRWLDPGDPWARQFSTSVIIDVVKRYDIDGVHIDDYFYPYPESHIPGKPGRPAFPDGATYSKYGGGLDRDAWRRQNIDTFVGNLYKSVKKTKPWVKFGISPFGIWRPGTPAGIEAGLDSYGHLYADSRKWLREGWCDYFVPQLYWSIKPQKQSFTTLLTWWDQQNRRRRHLWPGIDTSRIKSGSRSASEITAQIEASRQLTRRSVAGHSHWSIAALKKNKGGIKRLLASQSYRTRALVPPSPWLGGSKLAAPQVSQSLDSITWSAGNTKKVRWWAVQVKDRGQWSLAAVVPAKQRSFRLPGSPTSVAVRAVGFYGKTSAPGIAK